MRFTGESGAEWDYDESARIGEKSGFGEVFGGTDATAKPVAIKRAGRGEVDFDACFAALADVGFDGVLSSCVFGWEERAREASVHQRDTALTFLTKHFGDDVAATVRGT